MQTRICRFHMCKYSLQIKSWSLCMCIGISAQKNRAFWRKKGANGHFSVQKDGAKLDPSSVNGIGLTKLHPKAQKWTLLLARDGTYNVIGMNVPILTLSLPWPRSLVNLSFINVISIH